MTVAHLPWDDVRADIRTARHSTTRASERFWLDQLSLYLAGATAVRDPAEQWVYVVVAFPDKPAGGGSRTDFVTDERAYFHPFGKNWPKQPPVLMGFRWDGHIRQVNRVMHSKSSRTCRRDGQTSHATPTLPSGRMPSTT